MAGPKAVSYGIEAKNLPKGKLVVLGRFLYALNFLFVVPATSAFSFTRGAAVRDFRHRWWAKHPARLSRKTRRGPHHVVSSSHDLNDGQVLGYARPADRPAAYGAVHGNVALIGGALLISQFGAGPISVDAWRTR
jgi:hypothetical protein